MKEYDYAKKYCSQLAEYYFNTRYQKYVKGQLSGSYIAVNVIEDLCINGRRKISREEFTRAIMAGDPNRASFLEGRAERMIDFCKNPGDKWPEPLLNDEGGIKGTAHFDAKMHSTLI